MYTFFQKLIDQGFALVYRDDFLFLAHPKTLVSMLDSIEQLHQICSFNYLKIAPDKFFFILLTVKILDIKMATILLNQFFPKLMVSTN